MGSKEGKATTENVSSWEDSSGRETTASGNNGWEPVMGGSLVCPGAHEDQAGPRGGAAGSFAIPGTCLWRGVGALAPKTEAPGPVMTALQGLSRGAGWLGL